MTVSSSFSCSSPHFIFITQSRLDNIVEFLLPVPSLPNPAELAMLLTASGNRNGNSRNSSGSSEREGPPAARLTLKHDYEIQGNCTVKVGEGGDTTPL